MENYVFLDPNMVIDTELNESGIEWHSVREPVFALHGFYEPLTEPYFHRMPEAAAAGVSENVFRLQKESAGGRVRFSTDSKYIAIKAHFLVVGRASHLTLVSSAGFDLYEDTPFGSRYIREFRMPYDMTDEYKQIIYLPCAGMRSYTIHFPVHSVVDSLEIGLSPASHIAPERPYAPILPVVFYGSSIVHGTAASRPGMIYEGIISRQLNIDYVNLGFSGWAKGEKTMAEYCAALPMSIFVCDYDHNAENAEALQQTHWPFYETFRLAQPDTPYIMISRPNFYTCQDIEEDLLERRDIIYRSYMRARANGDRNVYFIDGFSLFDSRSLYECTLDKVHPNDHGFICMADRIGAVIRYILMKQYSGDADKQPGQE